MAFIARAQTANIKGSASIYNKPAAYAAIQLKGSGFKTMADSTGHFILTNIPAGSYILSVLHMGAEDFEQQILVKAEEEFTIRINLTENNRTINEVVVTGVTKATRIKENPAAIVSISAKQIEQATESNIIDALVKNAPGLHAVKTGPNISKPIIRGLGYNRVLTLFDGMRQEGQQWGDEHGIEVDAYNIEKAEIIKGPASLMYGSDALAGVVSLFAPMPQLKDGKMHGKYTGEYQTNNNLIGNGFNIEKSKKNLSFVLRGSFRMAKNYRNNIDGRVYNTGFNEKHIAGSAGYTTARGYTNLNFTLYDNRQGIPDGSRDSASRRFTKQTEEGDMDSIKNRLIVSDNELNAYTIPALSQHIQHYRIYVHHVYQLRKGDIDMLVGAQQNIRREYAHPTVPNQPGMYVRLNTLNYGIRYNMPKWANFETTIGMNGMLQNNKNLRATDFPIPDYRLYDGGIYLFAKWKYKKWTISGGARYDMRYVEWNDFYIRTSTANGFNEQVFVPDTASASLQFNAYRKKFSGTSASIGVTYAATKQISIKANIGKGYRAPNITEMASNGLDPGAHIVYLGNTGFNAEFSLQEDIGLMARFADFSAEVNLFNNHIQNYIYQSMVVDVNGNAVTDAQGNKTFQYQQSTAQLYGAEIWFALHPKKISAFRWDNSLAIVYGFNRKNIYTNKGINGEYLPFIPPAKLLSAISYTMHPIQKHSFSLHPKMEMELSAMQNRYLALNNTETPTQGYVLFNIGISATIPYSKNYTAQLLLQVNNLLDKAYQSNLSRLKYLEHYQQSPNGHYGIYNMGRNICVKCVLSF